MPDQGAVVGRVLGTEDSTPLLFNVALNEGSYLQLDDVAVTIRQVPGFGAVMIAGVVTEVTARHEGASFGSDVFLISDGVLPARVQETAEITTTRVEPECYVPPRPGRTGPPRHRRRPRARAVLRPDGPQAPDRPRPGRRDRSTSTSTSWTAPAARTSRSAASRGVATKTSYALFLLHSIFRSGVLGNRAVNAKALVFSVKGEDLLFLDHANIRLDDDLRQAYAQLGLPAEPFASVGFYSPPPPTTSPAGRTWRADQRRRPRSGGRWRSSATASCCPTSSPTPRTNATSTRWSSARSPPGCGWTRRAAGKDGGVSIDGVTCRTYDDWSTSSSTGSPTTPPGRQWAGPVTGVGTINAFIRRLRVIAEAAAAALIRADLPDTGTRQISTGNQQVTVVDLHNLPGAGAAVRGRCRAGRGDRAQGGRPGPGSLLFTMIDELNKYAPREGNSPIKDVLLDIAERGRSLGIILIGAQQTASEVERRIVSNSSIKVVGRLDAAEAGRPEYGFLPPSQRHPGHPGQAGHHVRQPAGDPGAAVRSSSRSRPGPPGRPNAAPRHRHRRTGRRRTGFSRLPQPADDAPPF